MTPSTAHAIRAGKRLNCLRCPGDHVTDDHPTQPRPDLVQAAHQLRQKRLLEDGRL